MATNRRNPPPRSGAQPAANQSNGAPSGTNGGSSAAAESSTRRKPGPRRPWSERLAEQEQKLARLKEEGRRDAINKTGKDDLVTQKIWKKLRLVNNAAMILKEMGLNDESCIEANTELEQALNERLGALREDPSLAVPIPKKAKKDETSAAGDDDDDDDADANEAALEKASASSSGRGKNTNVGPFP